jgi:hypothetical protein
MIFEHHVRNTLFVFVDGDPVFILAVEFTAAPDLLRSRV